MLVHPVTLAQPAWKATLKVSEHGVARVIYAMKRRQHCHHSTLESFYLFLRYQCYSEYQVKNFPL